MKAPVKFILPLALVIAGCKVGPSHRTPPGVLPATYAATTRSMVATNDPNARLQAWWEVFGDRQLAGLVQTAVSSNLDIRLAAARVREARAQRGVTRSRLFPQIGSRGGYQRDRLSENTPAGQQAAAGGQSLDYNLFDAALDMSWEIDVFGGARRAAEAAQAELAGSVEAGREVLVTVLAEVGLSYLELRGAQRQEAIALEQLKLHEDTLALTRDRFQSGLASEADSLRAAANVDDTRAQIPVFTAAQQRAIHRIGILLGRPPQEFASVLLAHVPLPTPPPRVPVGLPSELLLQRPDIRRAERQVAAATARIGEARANLFPKFYLTAAAGVQSVEAADFLDGGSRFWSLGPGIRWPIFTAGRIRREIKARNARQEQALLGYEQTILKALEEVENALTAFGTEQQRHEALLSSAQATRRAAALAQERYRAGLTGFLEVLDAQRALLTVEDAAAQSERRLGENLIRLFKSFGGGWETAEVGLARSAF